MADPVLIEPTLTLAGQAAAFSADNTGLELKISHASFGRAHYDPTGEEVALVDPVGSKIPLAGGSRPTPYQLRMSVAWREDVGEVAVGEIGFWSGDTLVFIWSKADGSKASYKTDGVTYVLFNDLTFAQVPAGSINVDVDPNESVALAALAAHEGADNAHPQYLLRSDAAKDIGPLSWLGLAKGTQNDLVLTLVAEESVFTGYQEGQRFSFLSVLANSGPVTVNIEGKGAVPVRKASVDSTVPLAGGDIRSGVTYDLIYVGNYFQLGGGAVGASPGGAGTVTAAGSFSRDDGAVNAYHGTYVPAVAGLEDGLELAFLAKKANTGQSTFSPNSVDAKPIVDQQYLALTAGDIGAGALCTVRYLEILDAWVLTAISGNAIPSTLDGYGIKDAYTKSEIDSLVGGQARVVGAVSVTGSSSVTTGTVVTLTATAASLLSGGSIASFTWTLPDGTTSTTAATSGSATKAVTAVGSVGNNYNVSVYATDNAGNKSAVTVKAIAITNHQAPTAPTTFTVASSVFQGTTGNTLSVSGSVASDSATITYSITQSGSAALTLSKATGIASGVAITFTAPVVTVDTVITLNVIAVDSLGGQSTAKVVTITVAAVPSVPGTPFGGGYFVAKYKRNGSSYALIVAPKASGETTSYIMSSSSAPPLGATDVIDGATNQSQLVANGTSKNYPCAFWAKGKTIGGFSDWFIPSAYQMEMLYHYLKPTTAVNSTVSYTANPYADPATPVYTSAIPAQTTLAAFKDGGAEAFLTTVSYWTSNFIVSSSQGLIAPYFFTNGSKGIGGEWAYKEGHGCRLVREVKL